MNGLGFLHHATPKMLLFGGKGGVGKSTCSSATALHLAYAYPEDRFLLISTDPAHSLKDSLVSRALPDNLRVEELDSARHLEDFKAKHLEKIRQIALRGTFLDESDVDLFQNLTLPGMDEMMAFLELSRTALKGDYRCIVVDTAPTGHTLRLLEMPNLIRSWLDGLDTLLAKHRYMKNMLSRHYIKDEIDDFLLSHSKTVEAMSAFMKQPDQCQFVPVMLAEELSIQETKDLLNFLTQHQVPVMDVIVNRFHPEKGCSLCLSLRENQEERMKHFLAAPHKNDPCFWRIPLHAQEVYGEQLDNFFIQVEPFNHKVADPSRSKNSLPTRIQVKTPGPFPWRETQWLIFAGKGGVGKTTLAAATALRMVAECPDKKVLLLSTDPAHSLGDCLQKELNNHPTLVAKNLYAMELSSSQEYNELRNQYGEDLKKLFRSTSGGMDMPFDRQAMECFLDLAPSGIDELMASCRMATMLHKKQFDLLIVDSAPTGHMLRLLEIPPIMDHWLKAIFKILLKYKAIFGLPTVIQRLVQFSKELKILQAVLRDPNKSAACLVTIPTKMAFEETARLRKRCEQMGLNAPMLFLNLATPQNECPFCQQLFHQEKDLIKKQGPLLANFSCTTVFRGHEPLRIPSLEALGCELYQ